MKLTVEKQFGLCHTDNELKINTLDASLSSNTNAFTSLNILSHCFVNFAIL